MTQERRFFAILFVIVAAGAFAVLRPFLSYIVLAALLTFILFPIYTFLLRKTKRPQLSSALSVIIALTVMVIPTAYLISQIVGQVKAAYTSFKTGRLSNAAEYLMQVTGNPKVKDAVESGLDQIQTAVVSIAPDILGSISELILGLFVMFFVMFYGFREGESFVAHLKRILPLNEKLKDSLFFEVRTVTQAVLYGQVMTALIQGTLGGIGLFLFGVPNAVFWGSAMACTAFLPVLGTPIIWGPAAIDQILSGHLGRGIGLLAYGGIIVMNIDNVIRPRLVSGRTKVHPVLILIGALGGLQFFGFVGLLLGPLVLAILMALINFYDSTDTQAAEPSTHSPD